MSTINWVDGSNAYAAAAQAALEGESRKSDAKLLAMARAQEAALSETVATLDRRTRDGLLAGRRLKRATATARLIPNVATRPGHIKNSDIAHP